MERLKSKEMIENIETQAPTRISLFGGGTDLPVYYHDNGGLVISMAVSLRQHIKLSDSRLKYQRPDGASEMFYEAFFKDLGVTDKFFQASYDGDIRTGLGSSASAAVALIGALSVVNNLTINKQEIAERAWNIEVNKLKLYGGKQDQYAAAFGGANTITFGKDVQVLPLPRDVAEELSQHILLFDTGIRITDSKIQEELKELAPEQITALNSLKATALVARDLILKRKWQEVGELLDESWRYKKASNKKVSSGQIDGFYALGKIHGAWGGKLCGSGGGGCMIFMADPDTHAEITDSLTPQGLKKIDFSIDWDGLKVK